MDETIELRVVPTLAEYRRFMFLESVRSARFVLVVATISLLVFAASPLLPLTVQGSGARYRAMVALLYMPIVAFVLLPLAAYQKARRDWLGTAELRDPVTFTFREDGFHVVGPQCDVTLTWPLIVWVRRVPGIVALGTAQRGYYLVPTDRFEPPAAREAFERLLARKGPGSRRP